MINTRIDTKMVNQILGNAVKYSYGFLEGADMGQIEFNQRLGDFTATALGKYIDAHARMNPKALHHVYEWERVGDEGARLFEITPRASKRVIHFDGKFLQSTSVAPNSTESFSNKAYVMENAIGVTIEPRNSSVLVFEDDGETVFTMNDIYIANPGGDEVAGSFAHAIEDFFGNYFTNSLLRPFVSSLVSANEFSNNFPQGTKMGKQAGISAGIKYMKSAGSEIA